jgi:superfamily II RNA helicase
LAPEQCAALLSCFVFAEKVRRTSSSVFIHQDWIVNAWYRARNRSI